MTVVRNELSASEKRVVLLACLFALLVGNMMISNIVAFLPIYIENKNWVSDDGFKLNESDSGFIIAVFSIAQIIFAPFNGYIKNFLGTKNSIVIGFTMVTFTCVGLGLIANFDNPRSFLYAAVTLRFL